MDELEHRANIGWDLEVRRRFEHPRLNDQRLQQILQREHLDALVGTTVRTVRYGTEVHLMSQQDLDRTCAVVLAPGQRTIPLVVPYWELDQVIDARNPRVEPFTVEQFFIYAAADLSPAETLLSMARDRFKPHTSYPAAMAAAIGRVVPNGGRVGLESRGLPVLLFNELCRLLPHHSIATSDNLLDELLAVKSAEEIVAIREACELAADSMITVARTIRPGDTEEELARRYRDQVLSRNGQLSFGLIKGGGESSMVHMPPATIRLKPGDLVRFDVGCRWLGYCADVGRTYVVGEPRDARQQRIYSALRAGQEAAIKQLRPGAVVGSAFRAAVDAVRDAGVSPYDRGFVGHGIGQRVHEVPWLRADDAPLEKGMVLMVEIPYYEMGFGGYQLEDPVVITDNGAERLIHVPTEMAA